MIHLALTNRKANKVRILNEKPFSNNINCPPKEFVSEPRESVVRQVNLYS